jgi:hypothetical protein
LAVLLNEFCCFYSNEQVCENIPTWISLCLTTVFSQQGGISFFLFPKRFLELSWAKTSLFLTLFALLIL